MENDEEMEISKITRKDYENALKTMFLINFSHATRTLYMLTLPSYEETINKMNECYKNISSECLKKDISSLVDYTNNKYINRDTDNNEMTVTLDDITNFVSTVIDVNKKVYDGAVDKCSFSIDVNNALSQKQLAKADFKMMNKIFDCYIFSQYIKKEYTDHTIYPAIQKECIKAYDLIESDKGKEILLLYLPKKFLKVK